MERKTFLKIILGSTMLSTLSCFKRMGENLPEQDLVMPVLFVGHGSPMNAIEDNEFSRRWREMAQSIPTPKAVLIVSAHWLTRGTRVTAMEAPKTIHDFGGFPEALFKAQYPAPGSPLMAQETVNTIQSTKVELDHDWGLDHGAWSVVKQMYPNADIPMLQLSIDYNRPPQYHYDLARELASLRKKGVLILGSGNMVHNLGMMRLPGGNFDSINQEFGFDWTLEINELLKKKITDQDHQAVINYQSLHKDMRLAVPTPDHYYPLLYTLGLQGKNEGVSFFNDKAIAGSLTMTSVKIG